MVKLNKRKVEWFIREFEKGELSKYQIAKQLKVSRQWLNRLYDEYKRTGELPVPGKPGRPGAPIIQAEIDLIGAYKEEYGCGATNLETIMREHKVPISHNRIHRVLKYMGKAKNEKKKQAKRKWIRYERRHSNSLWHTDWFEYNGLQIVAYLDDASRLVTGVGVFDNATTENAILVLNKAIEDFGKPKQLCSDWGTQFTSDMFKQSLKQQEIEHVKAKVKHPQTNGKLERWWQTLRHNTEHFGDLQYAVWFYNNKRPHMSLNKPNQIVTPIQAFKNKQRRK
jgi:putative transposase